MIDAFQVRCRYPESFGLILLNLIQYVNELFCGADRTRTCNSTILIALTLIEESNLIPDLHDRALYQFTTAPFFFLLKILPFFLCSNFFSIYFKKKLESFYLIRASYQNLYVIISYIIPRYHLVSVRYCTYSQICFLQPYNHSITNSLTWSVLSRLDVVVCFEFVSFCFCSIYKYMNFSFPNQLFVDLFF